MDQASIVSATPAAVSVRLGELATRIPRDSLSSIRVRIDNIAQPHIAANGRIAESYIGAQASVREPYIQADGVIYTPNQAPSGVKVVLDSRKPSRQVPHASLGIMREGIYSPDSLSNTSVQDRVDNLVFDLKGRLFKYLLEQNKVNPGDQQQFKATFDAINNIAYWYVEDRKAPGNKQIRAMQAEEFLKPTDMHYFEDLASCLRVRNERARVYTGMMGHRGRPSMLAETRAQAKVQEIPTDIFMNQHLEKLMQRPNTTVQPTDYAAIFKNIALGEVYRDAVGHWIDERLQNLYDYKGFLAKSGTVNDGLNQAIYQLESMKHKMERVDGFEMNMRFLHGNKSKPEDLEKELQDDFIHIFDNRGVIDRLRKRSNEITPQQRRYASAIGALAIEKDRAEYMSYANQRKFDFTMTMGVEGDLLLPLVRDQKASSDRYEALFGHDGFREFSDEIDKVQVKRINVAKGKIDIVMKDPKLSIKQKIAEVSKIIEEVKAIQLNPQPQPAPAAVPPAPTQSLSAAPLPNAAAAGASSRQSSATPVATAGASAQSGASQPNTAAAAGAGVSP